MLRCCGHITLPVSRLSDGTFLHKVNWQVFVSVCLCISSCVKKNRLRSLAILSMVNEVEPL